MALAISGDDNTLQHGGWENPEFFNRLNKEGTLAHFYAHTSGDYNDGTTNETREASGAARGSGPSGF